MSTRLSEREAPERPTTYIRRSREEVARLAEGRQPFDYDTWVQKAPPATAEELAETEGFLRIRDAEREASLAAEAGISLHGAGGEEPAL